MSHESARSGRRMTSIPEVPEREIQRQILDWLKHKRIWSFRNNVIAVGAEYKGKKRFIRSGLPGSPDIYALRKGQLFGIEVKTKSGVQSRVQIEFETEFTAAGGIYGIVRTLDEAIAL